MIVLNAVSGRGISASEGGAGKNRRAETCPVRGGTLVQGGLVKRVPRRKRRKNQRARGRVVGSRVQVGNIGGCRGGDGWWWREGEYRSGGQGVARGPIRGDLA